MSVRIRQKSTVRELAILILGYFNAHYYAQETHTVKGAYYFHENLDRAAGAAAVIIDTTQWYATNDGTLDMQSGVDARQPWRRVTFQYCEPGAEMCLNDLRCWQSTARVSEGLGLK
jgi:hypothetical protein